MRRFMISAIGGLALLSMPALAQTPATTSDNLSDMLRQTLSRCDTSYPAVKPDAPNREIKINSDCARKVLGLLQLWINMANRCNKSATPTPTPLPSAAAKHHTDCKDADILWEMMSASFNPQAGATSGR